ncbi:zinc finger protein 2 homolog [Octopus vulgaris]|uniref:Zinc finger protein 2 homolog n=2 Tax=Octopus TaxID=6643 RepID=A0AA36BF93_OCTVU|nr:zinc finger protein 2 homolog [Octopus sinensis]XP_036364992.1 zinc finger protein 2 homolog [Octopus sinensis]XP_036364993.1 zinc finger protein 2 homolog [Octopus sinensis]XP_036364994.1 zinc finger protein 2 homolog [Octopus sinensis]CAI9733335.1 zinc finger protein 2 homolog [Octopus vulgaris]
MYSFQPVFPMGNQHNFYGQPMYPNNYLKCPEKPLLSSEKSYNTLDHCRNNDSSLMSPPPSFDRNVSEPQTHDSYAQKHPLQPPKDFQCSFCKKGFSNQFFLKNHELTHTGLKPFECSYCGKAFTQKINLKNHLRTHTGEKPFQCTVCNKSFSQRGNLKLHLRTHTGEKPFACDVCGKAFSQKINLNDHKRLHTGELYYCQFCKKPFCNQFFLKIHERIHTGELYKCTFCTKSFTLQINLKNHLRTHTGEKPFQCNVCSKAFSQRGNLKLHLRTHTGEKPFSCEVCGKAFSQKINLNDHKRLHTGDLFYCQYCKKPFCNQFFLKIHERIHTGELYKCEICNKEFTQKINLKNHHRTHTGEKPFQCNLCDKSFSQRGNLKLHLRTHAGEKPYCCDVCPKVFSQAGNLKTHLRTHTGEKPFKCDTCGKSFSQKANLNNHKRTRTGCELFTKNPQNYQSRAQSTPLASPNAVPPVINSETPTSNSRLPNQRHDKSSSFNTCTRGLNQKCSCPNCELFLKNPPLPQPPPVMLSGGGESSAESLDQKDHSLFPSYHSELHRDKQPQQESLPSLSPPLQKVPMKVNPTSSPHPTPMFFPHHRDSQIPSSRLQTPSIPVSHTSTPAYLHEMPQSWESNYLWSRGYPMPPLLGSSWPSVPSGYSCGVKQSKQTPWNNIQGIHAPSKSNPDIYGMEK